ncbi:hypothetical protein DAPPUDRAFT_237692 [Daphnia pulex]|uniref:Uncharacterized protein n=1 Tax=Daphnia pulex TaxID=6669 RepID=E9G5M0_DAPPU|nr:hypothetical protein DAPPUDRAFT_237692 [Daphnia pulex]|eukprot:EFX85226.1 hypothetical protein DAPPUDRAFT_237692 [Daphnia pulex]
MSSADKQNNAVRLEKLYRCRSSYGSLVYTRNDCRSDLYLKTLSVDSNQEETCPPHWHLRLLI